jgi:bifunctional DNase/RNase
VPGEADEVKVEVVAVAGEEVQYEDQEHRIPLVVLRDPATREIRVPIGSCEWLAIHITLEGYEAQRPQTHDLGIRLLDRLSARLQRVVIDELTSDTAHATLHLDTPQGALTLDARPGDAVALALRAEAPIYVTDDILSVGGGAGDIS